MKVYYIIENNYPIEKPPAKKFLDSRNSDELVIELNNYTVRTSSHATSPYDEQILLQINPYKPCGYNIDIFDFMATIAHFHDKEKKELYIIIDNNLFVFHDIYANGTIEKSIDHLVNMIDNTDKENNIFRTILYGNICVEALNYEDKFKIIYEFLEKYKNNINMNTSDVKNTYMSLYFEKYKFESLTNLINICNEQCACKKKSIKINKYDKKIIIHTCCSNKSFILKSVEYNFKSIELENMCDITIKTYR